MPRKSADSKEKTISSAERRKRSVKRGRKPTTTKVSKTKASAKTKSKVKAVARKVKAVAKTIKRKIKKGINPVSSQELSIGAPAVQVLTSIDDVLLSPQERVEDAKYFVAEEERAPAPLPEDLPSYYGDNKLVLMVRDPWWLFAYWELIPEEVSRRREEIPEEERSASQFVMRVYDISHIDFDGSNAHYYFDVVIPYGAERWYINVNAPGRSWVAEMGWLAPDGKFYPVVRSNVVATPLDGPSWITDEEWAVPEELFNKLYGLSVGFGGIGAGLSSAQIHGLWREQFVSPISSGAVSSWGGSAHMLKPSAGVGKKERGFWLVVNTELIVYGATEPDAEVTVQGQKIQLRPDGTFSLRFALPDGVQEIPVKAISSDRVDEITITPVVTKETK